MDERAPSIAELYDACYRRLVAQLFALTADLAAAQDAVQEAFVKALSSPQSIARADNPEAWLRTVAVNSARSRWRRLRHLDRLLGVGRTGVAEAAPALSPDHVAVVSALRGIPREQREAIALHHVADLPVSEVAALLDVPVGTVKARLSRGRARLAQLLADDERTVDPAEVARG
ncbi:RNA polymerase sigma-70 factor (ECF subfamily) [Motilibacter peucedani]|uniref:RNA polymerase sigma-70 factor (ECF subfamily) n=1 Tax=Motilibacter peucedani TaxID=598650 RepID=A0A420XQW7_9ACTN|nr:sigma-70 family RNA polymerase sigma factor [Motilibacter peucedani]RKS75637.1 RNA polymerase sigma-70 factor (ECF subfamily) [Motilibacter peucedani]